MAIFEDMLILKKLKAGDKTAFSFIFTSYYSDLVYFANTFLHNAESAEEIVQQIFVELWVDHENISINKSFKSYLLKSVQNKCFDFMRHISIKNKHFSFMMKNRVLFENETENYILWSELEERVSVALDEMPPDLSESFKMNRFQNLKYHEIAAELNVSVRTIEVRVSKALQYLRVFLKDYLNILIIISLLIN